MDVRFAVAKRLLWITQKLMRGEGRFVLGVAGKPVGGGRVELAVADTTAIPEGREVYGLVDFIVKLHAKAAVELGIRHAVAEGDGEMEMAARKMLAALEGEAPVRQGTWKSPEVGEA